MSRGHCLLICFGSQWICISAIRVVSRPKDVAFIQVTANVSVSLPLDLPHTRLFYTASAWCNSIFMKDERYVLYTD